VPVEFLHRDEPAPRYGVSAVKQPAIFPKADDGLKPWITREETNRRHSLDDLQRLVEQKRKA
jgi:hypothetical protein